MLPAAGKAERGEATGRCPARVRAASVCEAALTTAELAAQTGLNERYVREWAATMAAAGYLDSRPAEARFRMTPEQARVLASEDTPFFTAGAFQYAVACYRRLEKLRSAFQHGGGMPFADFGPEIVEAIERLFRVGSETWVADQWIPAVPDSQQKLAQRGEAAEVGWGAGQCLIPVALAFPRSRFWGYDVDARSLERAREKADRAGFGDRLSFAQMAAESLPLEERFDLVMAFNGIHDMAHPRAVLARLRRVLKPHGALLWSGAAVSNRLEDNLTTFGRTLYGARTMHCLTVSLAQHGEGLGSAIGENLARNLAAEAGFTTLLGTFQTPSRAGCKCLRPSLYKRDGTLSSRVTRPGGGSRRGRAFFPSRNGLPL